MGKENVWQDFRGRRQLERSEPNEAAFIAEWDSFYMATVSDTGRCSSYSAARATFARYSLKSSRGPALSDLGISRSDPVEQSPGLLGG
jgi:hypothetical protein